MIKAIELFESAIKMDPTYALAYAALANCYVYLGFLGAVAKDVYPKAKHAAAKALEIDEALAEAHAMLGYAATYYDWDWATAGRELERAIALNPNYAQGYLHYSWYLATQNRLEESRSAILRAKELDPFSIVIHANLSNYFHFSREHERAFVQSRKALELAPEAPIVLLFHGMTCLAKELHGEAVNVFKKLVDNTGGSPGFKGYLGYSYARAGNKTAAISILDELRVLSTTEYVPAFQFAFVLLGLEQFEEALSWLEKAFDERSSWFPHIRHDSIFDPLRNFPGFQNLVKRMNFLT
jgi:tetratricopeptide (TPR) repeat protein